MKGRRLLPTALFFILSLYAVDATAADTVRVVAAQAAIHLNADPNSITVATIPAGTVLELNGRQGAWYAVWLPADRPGGPRRLGFLAASDAELTPGDNSSSPAAPAPPEPQADTPALPPARQSSAGDFDGFGGVTLKLAGARAIVATTAGTADSGEHTTLPTFGFAVGGWISRNRVLGVFFDMSGVDGGSASAQVGSSNSSQVSSSLVDFHGGWQVQAPGRIRPYGFVGVGVAFAKTTGTITLAGRQVSSLDDTEHHLSTVAGAGVRFQVGDKWGVKVGVDFLAVRVSDNGDEQDYGRFVAGSFYSF